jgi:uncharacterized protein YggE
MKRITLLISALFFFLAGTAQEKNFIDCNYIEITGRAQTEVAPDEIYLNITINEKENKGKVSLEKQEKEMFKKLTSLNIDLEKNMTVLDMNSFYEKYILKKDKILITKSYILKVSSADMTAKVFAALEEVGIPDVSIAKTALSNVEKIRDGVMEKAAANAKEKAVLVANALGRKVGKAIFIQNYDNYLMLGRGVQPMTKMSISESDDSFVSPLLEFEKIRFEHTLLVRFELE